MYRNYAIFAGFPEDGAEQITGWMSLDDAEDTLEDMDQDAGGTCVINGEMIRIRHKSDLD